MPEITYKIDPVEGIIDSMKKQAGSQLGQKLHTVFNDVFNGDELDFLTAAILGVREIFDTAPPETKLNELIGMWADKKLRLLH